MSPAVLPRLHAQQIPSAASDPCTAERVAPHPRHRVYSPPHAQRDNWGYNQRSQAEVLQRPTSVQALQSAVIEAIRNDRTPCVVRGAMHSWSAIAVQKQGTAFDLSNMPDEIHIDRSARTARVSGAMRLGELYDRLAEHELGLAYIPTIEDATVAGAAATDTHGAERVSGRFVDQIREMRLIDGLGRNIAIDAEGCWALSNAGDRSLLIEGPEPLKYGRRHLGLLGVVYDITLNCVPAYDLQLHQRAMSESEAFGEGYRDLTRFLDAHAQADLFYFPNHGRVLLRHADAAEQGAPRQPRGWFASTFIDGFLRSDLASVALVVATRVPFLAKLISFVAAHTFGETVIRDRSDRVSTYLPGHVKRYVSFQTLEYGVPLSDLPAALDIVKAVTSTATLPLPMYMRRVGNTFFFELIWPKGFADGEETARALEARLIAELGDRAMPHEGKIYFTNPWPRASEARRRHFIALKRKLDPQGVFTSSYMRAYLDGLPPETCTACNTD